MESWRGGGTKTRSISWWLKFDPSPFGIDMVHTIHVMLIPYQSTPAYSWGGVPSKSDVIPTIKPREKHLSINWGLINKRGVD